MSHDEGGVFFFCSFTFSDFSLFLTLPQRSLVPLESLLPFAVSVLVVSFAAAVSVIFTNASHTQRHVTVNITKI